MSLFRRHRLVAGLTVGERQVPVLDHVPNLPLHGDAEQRDEVHDQDRPEHRHVKCLEEGANDPDDRALADGVPKFELR